MLKYIPIQSGSTGNTAVLYDETTLLILDAGVHPEEVLKVLSKNHLTLASFKTVHLLVTHQHMDHARFVSAWGQLIGIPNITKHWEHDNPLWEPIKGLKNTPKMVHQIIGSFSVTPHLVPHGNDTCYAYDIQQPKTGRKLLWTTDLHAVTDELLAMKDYDIYIIECNYNFFQLEHKADSSYYEVSARVDRAARHLEASDLIEYLNKVVGDNTKHIHFLHLSSTSGDGMSLVGPVAKAVGRLDQITYTYLPFSHIPNGDKPVISLDENPFTDIKNTMEVI